MDYNTSFLCCVCIGASQHLKLDSASMSASPGFGRNPIGYGHGWGQWMEPLHPARALPWLAIRYWLSILIGCLNMAAVGGGCFSYPTKSRAKRRVVDDIVYICWLLLLMTRCGYGSTWLGVGLWWSRVWTFNTVTVCNQAFSSHTQLLQLCR